jgi:hypothetical protein
MLGSAVIEVIIGLVFVYILLSLLVSQMNQLIANLLNIRAHTLRQRVEDLLYDNTLQERLLAHPVVGIIQPPVISKEVEDRRQRTTKVSNLAANTFSKALVNILSDPYINVYAALTTIEDKEQQESLRAVLDQLKANVGNPTRANAVFGRLQSEIDKLEEKDRNTLLRTLGPLQGSIRDIQSGNSGYLQILSGVSQIENRAFQQAMETVLSGVQNVKEAELAIEEWYDDKMAQTKNAYARRMELLSLLTGIILALMLNIDSLYLARTLWNDSALRDRLSVAANTAVINADEFTVQQPSVAGPGGQSPEDAISAAVDSYQIAEATFEQLLELRLPIGWTFKLPDASTDEAGVLVYDPRQDTRNLYNILVPWSSRGWIINVITKFVGLVVTAFAVAQGAPFWFDVLRRVSGQSNSDDRA